MSGAALSSSSSAARTWHRLTARSNLSLAFSLTNGQCFGWRRLTLTSPPNGEAFAGVIANAALLLREDATDGDVKYCVLNGNGGEGGDPSVIEAQLRDFFQLDCAPSLEQLYAQWSSGDARMGVVAQSLHGMRILRQDPVECLVSFICSSNNHISRIGQMLSKLRAAYGTLLASCEEGHELYSFPTLEALAAADEGALRGLGFGYRARFVREAAAQVLSAGGLPWLLSLRSQHRQHVQKALCALMGVGPKVADCVALFSLDQTGIIPVDTHVWAIATRHYDADGALASAKSLTPSVYERVGDAFRSRFGSHAGWAHSLLFAAELPSFRQFLPAEMVAEMSAAREGEKAVKAEKKAQKAAAKAAKTSARSSSSLSSALMAEEVLGDELAAANEDTVPFSSLSSSSSPSSFSFSFPAQASSANFSAVASSLSSASSSWPVVVASKGKNRRASAAVSMNSGAVICNSAASIPASFGSELLSASMTSESASSSSSSSAATALTSGAGAKSKKRRREAAAGTSSAAEMGSSAT